VVLGSVVEVGGEVEDSGWVGGIGVVLQNAGWWVEVHHPIEDAVNSPAAECGCVEPAARTSLAELRKNRLESHSTQRRLPDLR
jgi:hypothetical protein